MKHNVGEKVVLKNKRGSAWNLEGDMDKYIGKQVTIKSIDFLKNTFKIIEDNMNYWTFLNSDIDEEATAKLNEKWVSICELDWTEGARYVDNITKRFWKVNSSRLKNGEQDFNDVVDAKTISKMQFKKIEIDWSTIPVDTKIWVSEDGEEWLRRHFCEYKNNKVYAFQGGETSWTAILEPRSWGYVKLAEEEE